MLFCSDCQNIDSNQYPAFGPSVNLTESLKPVIFLIKRWSVMQSLTQSYERMIPHDSLLNSMFRNIYCQKLFVFYARKEHSF